MGKNGDEFMDKLTTVARSARQVSYEPESFAQVAEYLEKLVPVAVEMQRNGSKCVDVVDILGKDLDTVSDLIHLCNTNSQTYLLTRSRTVLGQLENVTHDMGKNLELVPVSSTPGKEDFQSALGSLSQEMQRVQFYLKDSERSLERDASSDSMFDTPVKRQGGRTSFQESRRTKRFEEPYESFCCPLTHQVMVDPVTIVETDKTYERRAIETWFHECQRNEKQVTCPVTSKKLQSLEVKPNLSLRSTIEEWRGRNEEARIESAVPMLSHGSPEADMIEAMEDITELCIQNKYNKLKILNEGIIPLLVDRLKNGEEVRCKALQTLKLLAEDDDHIKEAIGQTTAIWNAVKCLSRELSREREEAVSLLLELSKLQTMGEKIGALNGAILILVGMTSSRSENVVSAQKADETLDNLEKCDSNVRQMAENGRLKPLITRLLHGPEELRIQMAGYIADIPLNNEGKAKLAEAGSSILINMLRSNKVGIREVALKALRALSTLDTNGSLLINAGILPPLTKDLFMSQVPTKMKEVSATVLGNIISSCEDWETCEVDDDRNTLTSEQHVHNLLQLISNTGPAIEAKLLQVLLGLASSPNAISDVVAHIKSAGALVSLIQFLEAPQKELLVTSVRLLYCLSSFMGQELADGLRITTRQLSTLVKLLEQHGVNVEMAAAAGLLANLPVTDYNLTRALLDEGVVPILIKRINDLKRGVVRVGAGKYVAPFQEGLVAILARFTYDLDDPDMLQVARSNDLCTLFTSLLQTVSLKEVQRWSAISLENMSMKSKLLSYIPEPPAASGCLCFRKTPPPPPGLCPVHAGQCSARETFCLVEAGAVDPLVACLEHRDVEIVEATLQALSTLIQEPCDVERGVQILYNAGAVPPVLTILQEHKSEGLRQRSVWIVERVLRNADIAQTIAPNTDVTSSLVDAFRHGDYRSRQLAERSLKLLNRIPNFSGVFPTAGGKR